MPLLKWFTAFHLMATHSNGISALQLQSQLDLGSYKTAWLLLHKIRRAMVDPNRSKLEGSVEVDETSITFRTKDDPIAGGQGNSPIGKIFVMGAVELADDGKSTGRIRVAPIADHRGDTLKAFIRNEIVPDSKLLTDGAKAYKTAHGYGHHGKTIGKMAAHVFLPWVHRVFSNLKRWAMGTFHGFRKVHIHRYLREFEFRWNRRGNKRQTFDTLLGLATRIGHASERDFINQRV